MNIGEVLQRRVVTVLGTDSLLTAARLMRDEHIGYLVVVEPGLQEGEFKPIGVLTDRDIVLLVVARDVDVNAVCVGDVMTHNPIVVLLDDQIADVLGEMRRIGVRRLPVVGAFGHLKGVVSLDDILVKMADELGAAAGAIARGRGSERRRISALGVVMDAERLEQHVP